MSRATTPSRPPITPGKKPRTTSPPRTPLSLTKIGVGLDDTTGSAAGSRPTTGGPGKVRGLPRYRGDDDNESNASSELSVHEHDEATNARVVRYTPSTPHTAYRLEQQRETFDNALDEVMGFIEDYPINLDIIHALQAAKQKRLADQVRVSKSARFMLR